MKGIYFILLFSVITIIHSCSSSNKDNAYINDIDNLSSWFSHPTIIKGKAHSGLYMCKVDSINPYSIVYNRQLSEVALVGKKKIKFSAWCMSDTHIPKTAKLVLSIEEGKKSFLWKGPLLMPFMTDVNNWYEITGEADIPEGLPSESNLIFYLWSPDNETVFVDDFSLSFE